MALATQRSWVQFPGNAHNDNDTFSALQVTLNKPFLSVPLALRYALD